jgi:hypothetical protein
MTELSLPEIDTIASTTKRTKRTTKRPKTESEPPTTTFVPVTFCAQFTDETEQRGMLGETFTATATERELLTGVLEKLDEKSLAILRSLTINTNAPNFGWTSDSKSYTF